MSVLKDAASTASQDVHEGVLEIPGTFRLHFGGKLDGVKVAWRLVGDEGPVVAALGGISAGRIVTGSAPRGWWSEIVGPGAALDTNKCRLLGIDFLGGSGQSTGPHAGQSGFPSISAYDQASILQQLIQHLGLAQRAACHCSLCTEEGRWCGRPAVGTGARYGHLSQPGGVCRAIRW